MQAVAWILLLAALADLLSGGAGLHPLPGTLVLAAAGGILLALAMRRIRYHDPVVPAGVLAAAILLSGAGLAYPPGSPDRPAGSDPLVGRERRRIEKRWSRFTAGLEDLAARFQALDLDPGRAQRDGFRILEDLHASVSLPADRLGLALYLDDDLIAWAGESSAPRTEPGSSAGSESRYAVFHSGPQMRLVATVPNRRPELSLRAVILLSRPADPDPGRTALDLLGGGLGEAYDLRRPPPGAGSDPSPGLALLLPDGATFGEVVAREPETFARAFPSLNPSRAIAVAVLFLLFGGIFIRHALRPRAAGSTRTRLLDLSLLLWSARISLLLWSPAGTAFAASPFGPGAYASRSLGPLLRSPGDLCLTAVFLLGQAALILDHRLRRRRPGRAFPAFGRRWLPPFVGSAVILFLLIRFHLRLPYHTDRDLLRMEWLSADHAWLALGLALPLVNLSGLAFLIAFWVPALAGARDPGVTILRRPGPGILAAGLALTLLTLPALAAGYRDAAERFLDHGLRPQILEQEDLRERALRIAAEEIARDETLCREGAGPLAFVAWARSELARAGFDCSVLLLGPRGRDIDRFAVNLSLPEGPPRGAGPASPGGFEEEEEIGSSRLRMIHREGEYTCAGRPPGRFVLHMLNEPENLPFLPRVAGFPPSAWNGLPSVLPRFLEPLLVARVSGSRGPIRFSTEEDLPPPSAEAQDLFASETRTRRWETVRTPGGAVRMLSFPHGDFLWGIGYRIRGPLGACAAFIRFLFLNTAASALLLLLPGLRPGGMGFRREPLLQRFLGWVRAGFFRQLALAFLAASLLPLLPLTLFLGRLVDRQIESGQRGRALVALGAARRVVGDHLAASPADGSVTDDDLFWLSRVVQWPLSLYREGELEAASHTGLYRAGYLPRRLPGRSYREILQEARPFSLAPVRLGGLEYLQVSASLARESRPDLVVSVFLPAREGGREDEGTRFREALLVASTGLIATAGLLGFLVAGRISGPIRRLSRAARAIRSGDFQQQVTWASGDEVGTLVEAFNEMASGLHRQREDLLGHAAYMEAILNHATTGVVSLSPEHRIGTMNPAAARILDLEATLAPGTDLLAFLRDRPAWHGLVEFLERSVAADATRAGEIALQRGGTTVNLRMIRVPLPLREPGPAPGSILLFEDVTETVRSSRLAAWAEMARGIAHEIKNPLTPILLSAEHIRRIRSDRGAGFDRALEDGVATIVEQVEELRRIAREFSDYARLPDLQREATEVGRFLDGVISPYRRAAPAGVRLVLDCAADLPRVRLDRRVITRALVNLIENSLQAMPRGGEIRVKAERNPADPDGIRIGVEDTGEGIEPDRMQRIFEPYFSTRESGTGLGLALTRQAVEAHGGRIEAWSVAGRGTRMTLVLPSGTEDVPGKG